MNSKLEILESEEDWELDYSKTGVVIGLEIHSQLNSLKTKLFCSCDAQYREDEPNTHTCPVCMGLPGSMPVANKEAIGAAIKLALALNGDINNYQFFFRKNYYYPDMSKNFQITQYNRGGGVPFASGGYVSIKLKDGATKKIQIDRMHLEDDPGKLSHIGSLETSPYTQVDYNRCGTTLIEMVTKPEMYTPEEARAFVNKYKTILSYTGICDPAQDGSFRVDANVSLEGHNRVEIKNIGSVKEVERALKYEISRHKQMIKRNSKINRETRAWNGEQTILLRTKEQEDDYRYFPEPDLVPFKISKNEIQKIQKNMPELPDERMERYQKEYEMSEYDADVLINNKASADFYEECAKIYDDFKDLLNWINNNIQGYLNENNLEIQKTKLTPQLLVNLLKLVKDGKIGIEIAKEILPNVINGEDPVKIVKEKNLEIVSDETELEKLVEKVISENQDIIEAAKKAPKALNRFIGIIKKSMKTADISVIKKIISEKTGINF